MAVGCGSEGVDLDDNESAGVQEGAEIFAERCSGCHTLSAAGTQGSANRSERVQGPDFDQRNETVDDVLFAIRNGGFSGAIMPQNIVVGEDAQKVAEFVAKYAGKDVTEQPAPDSASQ
jgi:mono/diheme cytochrome c family protein